MKAFIFFGALTFISLATVLSIVAALFYKLGELAILSVDEQEKMYE